MISQRSGTANTGKKDSSKSSGGNIRPGSKSTTSLKSLVSPSVKRRKTIKGEGLLKTESDFHQQESIEEVRSEDSNMDEMRIEIDA